MARMLARLTCSPYGWHMPMAKTGGLRNLAVILSELAPRFCRHRFSHDQELHS